MVSLDIPRANSSINSPMQSSFLGRFLLFFANTTFVIPLIIGVGLLLALRLPMRFMLDALNILTLYPLANLMVTLCFILIIANLLDRKVKPIQIWLAVALAFLSMVLALGLIPSYLQELWASLYLFCLGSTLFYLWNRWKVGGGASDGTMRMGASTNSPVKHKKALPDILCMQRPTNPGSAPSGSGPGSGSGSGSGEAPRERIFNRNDSLLCEHCNAQGIPITLQ
jgi:hypothetical protein